MASVFRGRERYMIRRLQFNMAILPLSHILSTRHSPAFLCELPCCPSTVPHARRERLVRGRTCQKSRPSQVRWTHTRALEAGADLESPP